MLLFFGEEALLGEDFFFFERASIMALSAASEMGSRMLPRLAGELDFEGLEAGGFLPFPLLDAAK